MHEKKCVKADTEQILVRAIIDSDYDSSADFSDTELKLLGMRLQNVRGVAVDCELLQQRIRNSDKSLPSILALLNDLDREDLPDNERIFRIDEQKLQNL